MLTAGATFKKFGANPRYNPKGPSACIISLIVPIMPTAPLSPPTRVARDEDNTFLNTSAYTY